MEAKYFTSGQVARNLRISTSTLKRWLIAEEVLPEAARNVNGWRLFSAVDLEKLKKFKHEKRKNGKKFNLQVLTPVR